MEKLSRIKETEGHFLRSASTLEQYKKYWRTLPNLRVTRILYQRQYHDEPALGNFAITDNDIESNRVSIFQTRGSVVQLQGKWES